MEEIIESIPEAVTGKKRSSVGYDLVFCTQRLDRVLGGEAGRACARLMEDALRSAGVAEASAEVHENFVILRLRGVPADMSPSKAATAARKAAAEGLRPRFARIGAMACLWDAGLLARSEGAVRLDDALAFKSQRSPRKRMGKIGV